MDALKKRGTIYFVQAGIIAALYVAITMLFAPISSGVMQVRISEMLTVLPFFTEAAIPGLAIGCFIANIVVGCTALDVVAGTMATLVAAFITFKIKNKWFAPLPSVILNGVIIGLIQGPLMGFPTFFAILYVAAGQAVSCYALGLPLLLALDKVKDKIFKKNRRLDL